MKIIFDRSALHRASLDLFKGSPLIQLVNESKIIVYHTSTFIEETIRTVASTKPGAQDEIKRVWPFITSICNGGWFKPLLFGKPPMNSVCDDELNGAVKDSNWPLVAPELLNIVQAKLNGLIEEGKPLQELSDARPIYDINWQKMQQGRAVLAGLRANPVTGKTEPFAQYYQSESDLYASHAIMPDGS
jgi:hypothetical protein